MLSDYAHKIIAHQYRQLIKQERGVLADQDAECLHTMRVASRRLRTALQVFWMAVEVPKAANIRRIRAIAKTLGKLRDLDVQIAALTNDYYPQVPAAEQAALDSVIISLQQERRRAFAATADLLRRSRYRDFKNASETWLKHPAYTPLATLPLGTLLPDLLSPLLSQLLLHPGWLVTSADTLEAAETLHDLRKICKHVRYQAEFFVDFYDNDFKAWLQEIRELQSNLGQLQDAQVLSELLLEHLPKRAALPVLREVIGQTQADAMTDWQTKRQKYLEPTFRRQLHQLLLTNRAAAK